ncbi:MAG TPA: hypothetical protein VMA72_01960 [Streptosporangiaceae bacterium]|nr:hypothetical protein [Streptosporangiaceae bacterium]
MTETSSYPQAQPPPPPPPASGRPGGTGWTDSDLVIGSALVVLLIALFLPWFSVLGAAAADGPTSHGYLWIVFVLAIAALMVLVARDAIARLPGNLPSPEQMLVGATGLALLLTILGVVETPSLPGSTGPVVSKFFVGVGWSYGGWIAMIAALVAFVAAFAASRAAARARQRRPGTTA